MTSEAFHTFTKGTGSCLIVERLAVRLRQRTQGRLGQSHHALQVRHEQCPSSRAARTLASSSPPHDDSTVGEPPAHYAQRLRAMEATVRELLAAAQAHWRSGRRNPTRAASTRCSRWATACCCGPKELLDAADIGKLRPPWNGPYIATTCPSPNAYTPALPHKTRCSPTVNVDRLKPSSRGPPGPESDAGQEGEHEMELLLNRRAVRGVTRYLVRWRQPGGATRRLTTGGCGRRSWRTARRRWRSKTLPPLAHRAGPGAAPAPDALPPFQRRPSSISK